MSEEVKKMQLNFLANVTQVVSDAAPKGKLLRTSGGVLEEVDQFFKKLTPEMRMSSCYNLMAGLEHMEDEL